MAMREKYKACLIDGAFCVCYTCQDDDLKIICSCEDAEDAGYICAVLNEKEDEPERIKRDILALQAERTAIFAKCKLKNSRLWKSIDQARI